MTDTDHVAEARAFVDNLPNDDGYIAAYTRKGVQYRLTAADLRAALDELERLREELVTAPDGICGTTFGVEQAPMFICTLPSGHVPDGMHKNAGGTAWLLDSGAWTIQRGPWWGREPDADSAPQQPERGGEAG